MQTLSYTRGAYTYTYPADFAGLQAVRRLHPGFVAPISKLTVNVPI